MQAALDNPICNKWYDFENKESSIAVDNLKYFINFDECCRDFIDVAIGRVIYSILGT